MIENILNLIRWPLCVLQTGPEIIENAFILATEWAMDDIKLGIYGCLHMISTIINQVMLPVFILQTRIFWNLLTSL